jgi:hypothetical protein
MSALSDYMEQNILNWFRGTAFPAVPANLYVALFTAATDDTNAGGTEVSGNAYARQAVSTATSSWSAPGTAGVISNSNVIAFPAATPAGWGTVSHTALHDAATVGNRIVHGPLGTSKAVGIGDIFQFAAGTLSVTVG